MDRKDWTITVIAYDFGQCLSEEDVTAFMLDDYAQGNVKETRTVAYSSDDYSKVKDTYRMINDYLEAYNDRKNNRARLYFLVMGRDEYSAVFGSWIVPAFEELKVS